MRDGIIYERIAQESEIARQWWQLPPQTLLPLADGQRCLLIYAGEHGGSAGPDVRDAVLYFLPRNSEAADITLPTDESPRVANTQYSVAQNGADLARVGDVEFHIRASDWFAHNHHTDPRYNQVLLHVVFYLDSERPTLRQDGTQIPACSLLDLPQTPLYAPPWPCQQTPLSAEASTKTLLHAGLLRLNEKSQALSQAIAETNPPPSSTFKNKYDICLFTALAEAMGYGRDRAFFRAAGQLLIGLPTPIPEPLGHKPYPAPLDAQRLRILSTLSARWQRSGVWNTLLLSFRPELNVKSALAALRAAFQPLSQARTDILVCNVVLPFAVAVAKLENDTRLAARGQELYLAYPELVSNRITRMMSAQLQLSGEPGRACLQQGLHFVYAHTCQEKRCGGCLFGGQRGG